MDPEGIVKMGGILQGGRMEVGRDEETTGIPVVPCQIGLLALHGVDRHPARTNESVGFATYRR